MNKKLLIGALLVIVAVGAGAALLTGGPKTTNTPKAEANDEWDAAIASESAKINESLPTMVDEVTRLDATAAGKNQLTYKYTLVGEQKESVDVKEAREVLYPILVNGVCTAPQLQVYRDHGATLSYAYYDTDGDLIVEFDVDSGDCK